MKANYFWLTYDLGIEGDYDGIYAWLDGVKAKECGDSACYFEFDCEGKEPPKVILAAIKKAATLRPKDRIYLIWQKNGRSAGRFIHGSRKRAPWAGFAIESSEEDDDAVR